MLLRAFIICYFSVAVIEARCCNSCLIQSFNEAATILQFTIVRKSFLLIHNGLHSGPQVSIDCFEMKNKTKKKLIDKKLKKIQSST